MGKRFLTLADYPSKSRYYRRFFITETAFDENILCSSSILIYFLQVYYAFHIQGDKGLKKISNTTFLYDMRNVSSILRQLY
jgi:hypothetical protein